MSNKNIEISTNQGPIQAKEHSILQLFKSIYVTQLNVHVIYVGAGKLHVYPEINLMMYKATTRYNFE